MNNFIKHYGILLVGIFVRLFACLKYQESEERMANELKTQWHPAFCSAMKLELREDAEYLDYTSEYNLNTKPLQMDLLIVKKQKNIELKNEIGKIFRKHNIVEYKSPEDSMNENTFLKVVAYACLYKSYEEHVGDIKLDEITITMVREKTPEKLLCWYENNGYRIKEEYKGIYYVIKENHFPTQIIVSKQLSKESQKWLTLLSSNLKKEDAERVVLQVDGLKEDAEKRYGDSVLQVAMQENEELFNEIKEEETVCEALRKLMEPEFSEALNKAVNEAVDKAVNEAVDKAVNEAVSETEKNSRRNMILNALNTGSSAEDISKVMGIPLEEIKGIEKQK